MSGHQLTESKLYVHCGFHKTRNVLSYIFSLLLFLLLVYLV